MRPELVVVAGGSGSGKSTLAINLLKKYPEVFSLVHLDDYYKKAEDAPQLSDGGPHWDHPDAVRFDDIVRDLDTLLSGGSITVMTKSELYHPEYSPALKNKKKQVIAPASLVIFEGHLALYEARIRSRAALSVYLDIPIESSVTRRSGNKFSPSEGYFQQTLIPAHKEFLEPTKKHANHVIGAAGKSAHEVLQEAEHILFNGRRTNAGFRP